MTRLCSGSKGYLVLAKVSNIMENSSRGCQTWAIVIYLSITSLKGVFSMKLHRDLNAKQTTDWFLDS